MPGPTIKLSPEAEQVFRHALDLMEDPNGRGFLHEGQLGLFQQVQIGRAIARGLLRELEEKGLLEEREDKRQDALASFTRRPIEWQLTPIGAYHGISLRRGTASSAEPEAAGDWSPLPLDRDDAVRNAIEAVDAVVERVRGDNGFAATEPEDHRRVVWSLTTGVNALRDRLPSSQQVRALLLQPLKWLSERFMNAATGELAKEAVKALLKLITPGS